MRTALAVLLLLVSTFVQTACAANSKARIHAALQNIEVNTRMGDGECTAYAVGPHTLLTAAHCTDDNTIPSTVTVKLTGDKEASLVKAIISDGSDHILITFESRTFADWLELSLAPVPQQGDRVFVWGNPSAIYDAKDCYREGYYSGHTIIPRAGKPTLDVYLFIFPSAPGDSGSLIFNTSGEIIGVLGVGRAGFTGAFGLTFTPAQLAAASK